MLVIKVVKVNLKIIISLMWSKSVKQTVPNVENHWFKGLVLSWTWDKFFFESQSIDIDHLDVEDCFCQLFFVSNWLLTFQGLVFAISFFLVYNCGILKHRNVKNRFQMESHKKIVQKNLIIFHWRLLTMSSLSYLKSLHFELLDWIQNNRVSHLLYSV
jgi:hypothetical protein